MHLVITETGTGFHSRGRTCFLPRLYSGLSSKLFGTCPEAALLLPFRITAPPALLQDFDAVKDFPENQVEIRCIISVAIGPEVDGTAGPDEKVLDGFLRGAV